MTRLNNVGEGSGGGGGVQRLKVMLDRPLSKMSRQVVRRRYSV